MRRFIFFFVLFAPVAVGCKKEQNIALDFQGNFHIVLSGTLYKDDPFGPPSNNGTFPYNAVFETTLEAIDGTDSLRFSTRLCGIDSAAFLVLSNNSFSTIPLPSPEYGITWKEVNFSGHFITTDSLVFQLNTLSISTSVVNVRYNVSGTGRRL